MANNGNDSLQLTDEEEAQFKAISFAAVRHTMWVIDKLCEADDNGIDGYGDAVDHLKMATGYDQ